jgi:hypothetical protein
MKRSPVQIWNVALMTIQDLTKEERTILAAHMKIPFRCGGSHYINGEIYYILGGVYHNQSQVDLIMKKAQDKMISDAKLLIVNYDEVYKSLINKLKEI